MKKDILTEDQAGAILKAFDYAIKNGPWEKSNFLRMIGKNLTEIRDKFAQKVNGRSRAQIKFDNHLARRLELQGSQQEVFISLYSADGTNMQTWEKIVMNLPRQMISRPSYAEENQIQSLIKLKDNKQNEAYVAVHVNKSDILSLSIDKTLVDKLGNTLLALKDKSLDVENINRFIHTTGVYKLTRGHLIKES